MDEQRLKMLISARQEFEKFVKLEERANKFSNPAEAEPFRQEAESLRLQAEEKYSALSQSEAFPLRLPITSADSNTLERLEKVYVEKYTPEWLYAKYAPLWTQFEHSLIGQIPSFLSPIFNAPVRMSILFRPEGMKEFGWKPQAASAQRKAWKELGDFVENELEYVSPSQPQTETPADGSSQEPGRAVPTPARLAKKPGPTPARQTGQAPAPTHPDAASQPALPSSVPSPEVLALGPEKSTAAPLAPADKKAGVADADGSGRSNAVPTPEEVKSRFPDLAGSGPMPALGVPPVFPFKLLPLQSGSDRGILYDQTGSLFEWLKPADVPTSQQAMETAVDAEKLRILHSEMVRRQIRQIHLVVAPQALQPALQQLAARPEAKSAGLFSKQTILMPPQAFHDWMEREVKRLPVFSDGETSRSISAPHPLAAVAPSESGDKSAPGVWQRLFSRERSGSSRTESPQIIYLASSAQAGANAAGHFSPGQFVENVQNAVYAGQVARPQVLRAAKLSGLQAAAAETSQTGSAGAGSALPAPSPDFSFQAGPTTPPEASGFLIATNSTPAADAIRAESKAGPESQPEPLLTQPAGAGLPGAGETQRFYTLSQAEARPEMTANAEIRTSGSTPGGLVPGMSVSQPVNLFSLTAPAAGEKGRPVPPNAYMTGDVLFIPQPEIRPLGMPVAKGPRMKKNAQAWRDSALRSLILLIGGGKSAAVAAKSQTAQTPGQAAAEKPAPERRLAAADREETEWNSEASSDGQPWSAPQLARKFVAWFAKVSGKAKEQNLHPKQV